MSKSAGDIISKAQLQALREAGFVVVHRQPTESMMKAGLSAAGRVYGSLEQAYHRMVAQSIQLQKEAEQRGKGCGKRLAEGDWFHFCGETDMGQTAPALCTECGGTHTLA